MLATRDAEREQKEGCGEAIRRGNTLPGTVLVLLEFQRHCHRFRELVLATIREKSITFRVNHLECD